MMAYTTETWVLHRDWDKATITFKIGNFAAAVAAHEKDQGIESKPCTIGGSQLGVRVYPSGDARAAENKVSIYAGNYSDHKVAFKHSIMVGDVKKSESNAQVKGKSGNGWKHFMERKKVGTNLIVVVDITLLREEVGGDERVVDVNIGELKNDMEKMKMAQTENIEELKTEIKKIKQDIAMTRGPVKILECVICLEELRPPLRIVQCLKGHKLCEPCSTKGEVVSCPLNCRAGFMGRDHGMEAFVRQLLGELE